VKRSLDFLKQAIDANDRVTRRFVESMLPPLMEHYAVTSAKGGDHARDADLDEATKRKFEEKNDQSMVSHLLNGIFPTMRLLNLLEQEGLGPGPFSETERQVYILSYLMHDVDKILHLHGVPTESRDFIDQAKDLIAEQLRLCHAAEFFPDFTSYLEDITYLAVNTQQKYGTHLHTYLWKLHLPERRLLLLRRLCTYSDHIAYLVSSPAAILMDEAQTLTTILAELSDDELVFTYHQLREVRGLLTNVINNSLVHLFIDGHTGIWPYLFFSDGVVYLKRKSQQVALTTEQMVEAMQARLRDLCAPAIRSQAPGFKFDPKGILRHPGYYFEFLSLEVYAELLADFTIKRTIRDVTPVVKLLQMQANGEIAADLPLDFPAGDVRISMISRFFSVVFVTLLGMLEKKQEALYKQVEQAVIKHLGLTPYWEQARGIPNKGGVEYRWFWLGRCYLRDHQGITPYEGEGNLFALFRSTLQLVIDLAGDELREQMPQRYLGHLTRYLDSVVELPHSARASGSLPDFWGEMERYTGAKSKGRKLICTLCNSAYPTEEQDETAVLFQPWVYKNKLSLYAGKSAGGICAICSLELMLRQILQKGQLRLSGSKFEALKTKYLAVYPNYFFTAETGALVQGILDQLQSINFFTVRRELDRQDITVEALLHLEAFAPPPRSEMHPPVFIYEEDEETEKDEDTQEEEGEEEDGEQEAQEAQASSPDERTERGYIKFEQSAYPGLCFFGVPMSKGDDTSSWAMPAFLALALPLVTNTKVVISEMVLPLYASGHEFRETVIFDAPHPYLIRLLKGAGVRVNDLLRKLRVLTSIYTVNLDTYAKQGKPEWKHLSAIARALETDPLFLFSYLRRQERIAAPYAGEVQQYLHIYKDILEADMGRIQRCVDGYTVFYRGGYKSHSILKPVDIVAKAIITSPLEIEEDDLLLQIQGELKNWLDRVRSRQATGWAIFRGKDVEAKEAPAVAAFVKRFYVEVFQDYCWGERSLLHSRINRFKDGCEAYYVDKRNAGGFEEQEEAAEEVPVPSAVLS
jgi:CRISPR-associated protein Csc3